MSRAAQLLLAVCGACGGLDKTTTASSTRSLRPCNIVLGYESTLPSGYQDIPRFVARGYTESCKDFLGANIHTLRYRLNVQAQESAGALDQLWLDGRQVSLAAFQLSNRNIVVDDVNTSGIDNGPLQMEQVWVTFAFPRGSEIGLYPSKVELVITNRT